MNPAMHVVYVDRLKNHPDAAALQCDEAAVAIGLAREAQAARVVFLKPNLTYPYYKKGVTTRVDFVEDIVKLLLRVNPSVKILIGEGEGGYNSFSMADAMKTMGFGEIASRHRNVELINLSTVPARPVVIGTVRGPYQLDLPEIFFKDVDFSISIPLPKVHCMTRVTLSYKNLWGCLPDVLRLKNHYMFSHLIPKIGSLLKFRFAFLDGKFGLDTNGPMEGECVELNWFVAANSLGAFDMVVSEMMGFDWKRVGHLKTAERNGDIPHRDEIRIMGEKGGLGRQFTLNRNMWNYPALAGFHSKGLTQLFYLSRYAKLLHDIMYTFRARPIQ